MEENVNSSLQKVCIYCTHIYESVQDECAVLTLSLK